MGLDLVMAVVAFDTERKPDWNLGKAQIASVTASWLDSLSEEDLERIEDYAPWSPDGFTSEQLEVEMAKLRDGLQADLDQLERSHKDGYHSRECATLEVRGVRLIITAGMTHGETPTEAFDAFNRLWAFDVLSAIGSLPPGEGWRSV